MASLLALGLVTGPGLAHADDKTPPVLIVTASGYRPDKVDSPSETELTAQLQHLRPGKVMLYAERNASSAQVAAAYRALQAVSAIASLPDPVPPRPGVTNATTQGEALDTAARNPPYQQPDCDTLSQ
ncbi:hypothetical protein [Chitinimonas naiadis]